MKLQRLLSLIRQAVDQYEMIEEGDHHCYRDLRRKGQPYPSVGTSPFTEILSKTFFTVRNHCGYGNRYHESGTNQSAVPGNSSSL